MPAAQLRELGALLVQISGQHCSQQLLKPEYQLQLLDTFCHNQSLLQLDKSSISFVEATTAKNWRIFVNNVQKTRQESLTITLSN